MVVCHRSHYGHTNGAELNGKKSGWGNISAESWLWGTNVRPIYRLSRAVLLDIHDRHYMISMFGSDFFDKPLINLFDALLALKFLTVNVIAILLLPPSTTATTGSNIIVVMVSSVIEKHLVVCPVRIRLTNVQTKDQNNRQSIISKNNRREC